LTRYLFCHFQIFFFSGLSTWQPTVLSPCNAFFFSVVRTAKCHAQTPTFWSPSVPCHHHRWRRTFWFLSTSLSSKNNMSQTASRVMPKDTGMILRSSASMPLYTRLKSRKVCYMDLARGVVM